MKSALAKETSTAFVSRYDKRVLLVKDVVGAHTKLGDKAAAELATQIVRTLDTVPENVH
ncbi:DUF6307 family protein [Amycolatopsis minnesotensis]|uniref:DUF6307 family protein n=1 Tax=Amycolatopsis minnesotensis TaxID=337894 RepID=A0ABN2RCP8_9PSEU